MKRTPFLERCDLLFTRNVLFTQCAFGGFSRVVSSSLARRMFRIAHVFSESRVSRETRPVSRLLCISFCEKFISSSAFGFSQDVKFFTQGCLAPHETCHVSLEKHSVSLKTLTPSHEKRFTSICARYKLGGNLEI